jgi:hypothetical protein
MLVGGLSFGLLVGLIFGLVGGLSFGLLGGIDYIEVESRTIPNQGVRLSVRNMLIAGLFFWLVGWLVGGLFFGLIFWLLGVLVGELAGGLVAGLVFGLLAGLAVGLIGGLIYYGGRAVTLHLVLRFFLHRYNYLPWHVVPFLDYCTERIFLRKVGGGYIFIHRLLQEYFASLYEEGAA